MTNPNPTPGAEPVLRTALTDTNTGHETDHMTLHTFHNNWIFPDGSRTWLPSDFTSSITASRTAITNQSYTISSVDRYVAQIGNLSAPRIFTLPAASSLTAGTEIMIADESGSANATNFIQIQRGGSDLIPDGFLGGAQFIASPYGWMKVRSDGISNWYAYGSPTKIVSGPLTSVNAHFVTFSGTTGAVLQDSGVVLDLDKNLTANSDTRLPSQAAVKAYVDAIPIIGSGTDVTVSPPASGVVAINLSSGVRTRSIRKTGDTTKTSNATFGADPDLFLSVDALGVYQFMFYLIVLSPAAADFKLKLSAPAGSTADWVNNAPSTSAGTGDPLGGLDQTARAITDNGVIGGTDSVTTMTIAQGILTIGSTPGTFGLTWAQNTSNGGNTILKTGSTLILTKVVPS